MNDRHRISQKIAGYPPARPANAQVPPGAVRIFPRSDIPLINLICVNKIKNTGKIERFQERKVDL